MSLVLVLLTLALVLGGFWLCVFIWSVRAGQYSDPEGAARRILED